MEAEIESTDTLRADNNELFGAKLLTSNFLLDKFDKELPESVVKEDLLVLPGAVPRKQLQIRVSKSLSRGRQSKTAYPGGKSQHEIPITGKNLAAKDRPGSVSSQQTFVLENDIRKPLIIRNVFQ
ncbi:unnamed protein product [Enterobius vermicularis]|uniref:Uncharacterized protein n=1 Tax=Enterobius vermicularis TaxID=51028 RepID=A0A0N4VHQ7_ENTVE|nr:unnamed protein product [Enterobius vermicularis]